MLIVYVIVAIKKLRNNLSFEAMLVFISINTLNFDLLKYYS